MKVRIAGQEQPQTIDVKWIFMVTAPYCVQLVRGDKIGEGRKMLYSNLKPGDWVAIGAGNASPWCPGRIIGVVEFVKQLTTEEVIQSLITI